jgi:hypothetical protein
MTYELGQIIYVLSSKTQTVVPAVIEEEFLHKKLNGNVVTYKVSIGPPGKRKIVDLDRVDGEVFTSLEEIRNTLVERLTGFVNDLINTTEERTKNWYGSQSPVTSNNESKGSPDKIDPQAFLEQASSVPTAAAPISRPQQLPKSVDPKQAMREQLRSMIDPGGPELPGGVEETEIVDADGKVKKVTINFNGNSQ